MSDSQRGTFLVISAAAIWSTSGFFVKFLRVDSLLFTAIRASIAGLFYLMFLRRDKIRFGKYVWGYLVSYAFNCISLMTALKLTAATNAMALQYTAPFFLYIFGLLTRTEKSTVYNTIPMALVLIGIMVILLEPNQGSSLLGNMFGFMSGICFAAVTYFLHRLKNKEGITLVAFSNLFTAFLLLPYLFSKRDVVMALTPATWLSFVYLGVIQLGIGYFLYSKGLRHISTLRASILALIEAILNPIWVFLLLGEKPTRYGMWGSVLVIGAVSLDVLLNSTGANSENALPGKEL